MAKQKIEPKAVIRQLGEVQDEIDWAFEHFRPFHSAHEGLAIIWEELTELKEQVFKKKSKRDIKKMRKEATQVAAMATRFIVDICDAPPGVKD